MLGQGRTGCTQTSSKQTAVGRNWIYRDDKRLLRSFTLTLHIHLVLVRCHDNLMSVMYAVLLLFSFLNKGDIHILSRVPDAYLKVLELGIDAISNFIAWQRQSLSLFVTYC
jgi:uncharacterized membrane protein